MPYINIIKSSTYNSAIKYSTFFKQNISAGEIQNLKLKASVKERPAKHAKDVFHVEFEHDPTTVLNLLGHFDYRVITSIIDPNTNLISWTMERPMYLYQN